MAGCHAVLSSAPAVGLLDEMQDRAGAFIDPRNQRQLTDHFRLLERHDAVRALVQTQEDLVAARLRLRQSEARVAAVAHDAGRAEAAQASSTER